MTDQKDDGRVINPTGDALLLEQRWMKSEREWWAERDALQAEVRRLRDLHEAALELSKYVDRAKKALGEDYYTGRPLDEAIAELVKERDTLRDLLEDRRDRQDD